MSYLVEQLIDGLKVVQPKAFPGDRVSVHNYKSKGKSQVWESGEVRSVSSGWQKDMESGAITIRHSYDVLLDRRSKPNKYNGRDNPLWLYVNDDGIEIEKTDTDEEN